MENINTKDIYKSFANEKRIQLMLCLEKEKSVNELLGYCELSQSALSQHLKILKDSEIIKCERDGKKQMYSIKNKKVLKIAKLLLELR